MFILNPTPTFKATLTIVGQGREQKLNCTFRHKSRSEYKQLLEDIGSEKLSVSEALLALIEEWDADGELSAASIDKLQDAQPGIDWAIITGYGEALTVARKGN
jgi:hypothetical protein